MTTLIRDQSGKVVSQSHNLRGMLDGARKYGGVSCINVYQVRQDHPEGAKRPEGFVRVEYANGYTAETYFVSYSHLVEWSNDKAKRRGTGWTDASVNRYRGERAHVAGSEHEVTK
jgi:hypothetical protein